MVFIKYREHQNQNCGGNSIGSSSQISHHSSNQPLQLESVATRVFKLSQASSSFVKHFQSF